MVRFKSIFAGLVFSHAIAILLTAMVMPAALYVLLDSEVTQLHNRAMLKQAERLGRYISLTPNNDIILHLPAELESQYSAAYGRYFYAVIDSERKTLLSSIKARDAVFPDDELASEPEPLSRTLGNAQISGVSYPTEINGRAVWIQTAEDLSHRDVLTDDVVSDFVLRVGWIVPPLLVLLLTIDIILFRRVARPLLRASEQAIAIGPERIDVRLPIKGIPSEILPLVQSVNQALDRLEQGFRIQREFTADAAHELRTPLAVMRGRTETLGDGPVRSGLLQDISGMARIIGQMLDIAELDVLVVGDDEIADLQAACVEVVEALAPLAVAADKSIGLVGPDEPIKVKGNQEMIYRAIRNLVENAISHTPASKAVEITLTRDGTVVVADEGPGVRDDERDLVFRRFWRRDRRRAGSAGLGLAIVQRIAEAHQTVVEINNRSSGGAEFSIRFRCVEKSLP